MNKNIMKQMGFGRQVKLVEEKTCPKCRTKISMASFKDQQSIKEYRISGLCQECQDSIFGA